MSTRANKGHVCGSQRVTRNRLRATISTFPIVLGQNKFEFYDGCLWLTRAAAEIAVGDWFGRVYNRR